MCSAMARESVPVRNRPFVGKLAKMKGTLHELESVLGFATWDAHLLRGRGFSSTTQTVVALSSGESEFFALEKAVSMALGAQAMETKSSQ